MMLSESILTSTKAKCLRKKHCIFNVFHCPIMCRSFSFNGIMVSSKFPDIKLFLPSYTISKLYLYPALKIRFYEVVRISTVLQHDSLRVCWVRAVQSNTSCFDHVKSHAILYQVLVCISKCVLKLINSSCLFKQRCVVTRMVVCATVQIFFTPCGLLFSNKMERMSAYCSRFAYQPSFGHCCFSLAQLAAIGFAS